MYLFESVSLHFATNHYITVTCCLLSFFYWERYELKEKCSSYLNINVLTSLLFFRVCLTGVTGLIVSRPSVNFGFAYVAFMSTKPYERMSLQRYKSITDVVKYRLTQGVRKAI